MSQVARKWIKDSAINSAKIDSGDTYTMFGVQTTSDATVGSVLKVVSTSHLADTTVAGDATIAQYLTVSGPTTLHSTLSTNGAVTFNDTLSATGATTSLRDATLASGLYVGGDATVVGDLSVMGDMNIDDISMNDLSLTGDLSVEGNIIPNVAGTSNLGDATHRFANVFMASNIDVAVGSDLSILQDSSTRMVLKNSTGRVGIGTTNPDQTLTLNASLYPGMSFTVDGVGKSYIGVATDANHWVNGSVANDFCIRNESGKILINSNTTTFNGMAVTSNGKVGIGTINPIVGSGLQVEGIAPVVFVRHNGLANGLMMQQDTNGDAYVFQNYNRPMFLGTNASTKMTITAAGLVGIGTTNPLTKLSINPYGTDYTSGLSIGCSEVNVGLNIWHDNTGQTTSYIENRYDGANSKIRIRMRTNGTPVDTMTILGSGIVGIGTTNPSEGTLEVRTGATTGINSGLFVGDSNYGTEHYFVLKIDSTNQRVHLDSAKGGGGTVPLCINAANGAGQKVGIGTDAPNALLTTANGIGGCISIKNTDDSYKTTFFFNHESVTNQRCGIGTNSTNTALRVAGYDSNTNMQEGHDAAIGVMNKNTTNGNTSGFDSVNYNGITDGSVRFVHGNNHSAINPQSSIWFLNTPGSDGVNLLTRMVIKENGNVGIGTTSPGALLHVKGIDDTFMQIESTANNSRAGIVFRNDDQSNYFQIEYDDIDANSDSLYIRRTSATIPSFMISSTNKIGIGTTYPQAKLHIQNQGDDQTGLRVVSGNTSSADVVFFSGNTSLDYTFVMKQNGKVGIGTSSPMLGTRLTICDNQGSDTHLVWINNYGDQYYQQGIMVAHPNIGNDKYCTCYSLGKTWTSHNGAGIGWYHANDGSTSNFMYLGGHSVNNIMVLQMNNRVGVGTTNPQAHFHIEDNNDSLGTFYIYNHATSYNNTLIYMQSATTGTGYWHLQCVSGSNTVFKVRSDGQIYSDAGTVISSPADFAEWTKVQGELEDYEVGDIVMQSEDDLTVCKAENTEVVYGIVTDRAVFCGGLTEAFEDSEVRRDALDMDEEEYSEKYNALQIAMVGHVQVKVVGTIRKNQLLTLSEIPGVARAATTFEEKALALGIARQDYDSDGVGLIEVRLK
jgi:hypothetical protein